MPTSYTLELNDDQELALAYEAERLSAIPVPGSDGLVTKTTAEVLSAYVAEWLARLGAPVQATLEPLLAMVEAARPEMRTALIMGTPRPALRRYLLRKYGGQG